MISYRKLAMRVLGHSPVSAARTARRSTAKRAAALALTAALVVGMTLPAFAQDWYIEDGDISISAGETGNKVTQGSTTKENDTDTVIKSKDSSTASSNTVTIHADEGKTVNVTLDNVTINVDEGYEHGYDPNAYKTAVSVTGSGNTNIELNGNNTLTSGYGHAGLEHNKTDGSGTLTIQDEKNDDGSAKGSASDTTGSLTANGGGRGAGIGGSDEHDGQATITGGKITATGGNGAAGIGGGAGDKYAAVGGDGDVTISGGTITATGGSLAAGIGGGLDGNGTVIITDGDITAKATGRYGAGIGGGCGEIPKGTLIGGNGTVTISGGTTETPKAEHKLYINGFTDGMFHAERNITREQTAKMLIDALEKETAEPEQSSYTDVANNRWSYRWVEAASKEGYMVGYNGGVFKPDSAITRAEMATALSRIAAKEGLIMTSSTKTFSDVANGKWYSSYIRQAVQYGLISGYTDGTFRPEQYITRAETVTMINRMLGRNYETAAELHSMACPFPDVSQSNWAYGNIMEAAITHKH